MWPDLQRRVERARRDGPTTRGSPFLVREALHRVEDLNRVTRRKRAARLLAEYVAERPDQRSVVAEMVVKSGDAFFVAQQLGLVAEPVVTLRRRLPARR